MVFKLRLYHARRGQTSSALFRGKSTMNFWLVEIPLIYIALLGSRFLAWMPVEITELFNRQKLIVALPLEVELLPASQRV